MARTVYLQTATQANATHTATNETSIALTADSGGTLSGTLAGGASAFTHLFTGDANVPNDSSWPTGDYSVSLNVTTAGADITYGFTTAGSNTGHMARWNSTGGDQDTWAQTEGLFSGTGVKTATTGSVTPGSAATSDRFEALLAATRATNHGNQTLTITCNSSSSVTGPWTAVTFTPELTAFRFYDDDGDEAGSTPLAAQDTNISLDASGDPIVHLRLMVEETGGLSGATTDDYTLEYSKNSGTWSQFSSTDTGDGILDGVTANISDGSLTTNRATNGITDPGAGSFVAGEQSTNAPLFDMQLTANNFTEHVFSFKFTDANTSASDTFDFRFEAANGLENIVNTAVPRVTITAAAATNRLLLINPPQFNGEL
jgi:hypothetical protein